MRPPRASLAILAAAAVVACLPSTAAAADSGTCPAPAPYAGAGTAADPLVLSTPGNLQALRDTSADWGKHIRLAADIDMAGCTWGSSFGPAPATFTGVFDGDGHVIRGFALSVSDGNSYAGFVPYLGQGGVVRDLGVEGSVQSTVTGIDSVGSYTGGLVGFTVGSTLVSRSFFRGSVTAVVSAAEDMGGPQCNPTCPGAASVIAGGLVGNSQSSVEDSYARAQVQGSATGTGAGSFARAAVGGAFGALALGTASRVYAVGAVSGTSVAASATRAVGGFAGENGAYAALAASAWDSGVGPPGNGAGIGQPAGTALSSTAMRTFGSFGPAGLEWSITDGYSPSTTWGICPGVNDGYPFLSSFVARSGCASPQPGPEPDPAPGSATDRFPAQGSATRGGTAPASVPVRPRVVTMLGVGAQERPAIPVARRSTLVDGVRTNGTVTGIGAWCELHGTRVPMALQRRLCGIDVDRGAVAGGRPKDARIIRVAARPTCSAGLVMRVRINAKAAGARRATWTRSWRASSSPPVPCRIAPKYAVTG